MKKLTIAELVDIDGIGEVLAESFVDYFAEPENQSLVEQLSEILHVQYPEQRSQLPLKGMTFVITGSLNHFANRQECKEKIESLGGKVAGSVSTKTTYLVNNDITSMSSKNKKAKELSVTIIDEEKLCQLLQKVSDEL